MALPGGENLDVSFQAPTGYLAAQKGLLEMPSLWRAGAPPGRLEVQVFARIFDMFVEIVGFILIRRVCWPLFPGPV